MARELAKQDASYPGKQRFLAYSYERTFPPGPTYSIYASVKPETT